MEKLFQDWKETIIWSCLQKVMGDVYADHNSEPKSASVMLGDFGFFAGHFSFNLHRYYFALIVDFTLDL